MAESYLHFDDLHSYMAGNKQGIVYNNMPAAQEMLPVISNALRLEAKKVGKDLDKMIENDPAFESVVKSVVADIAFRYFATFDTGTPMTQMSQTAGGYTVSGSPLVPGGGLFIKKAELARLGLRRQRYGVMDFYGLSD
jgi:hypothetical protein